jgi:hypothetical protein
MENSSSIINSAVFFVAILGGLFVANLLLILLKSPYRISFIGSILITLVLFVIQVFL